MPDEPSNPEPYMALSPYVLLPCLKLPAEGRVARLGPDVGCQLVEVHPFEDLSVGAVRGFDKGSSRLL